MLDIAEIFHGRAPNGAKLLAAGFAATDGAYRREYPLPVAGFQMQVTVADGAPTVRVVDSDSGEDYMLIRNPDATGSFIGGVREACKAVLRQIADTCYDGETFRSTQAKAVLAYVRKRYGDEPKFLWKKFPDNAVLRRRDTGKWYAALLTVARGKIGLAGDGTVEILDLRESLDEVARLTAAPPYFPATT